LAKALETCAGLIRGNSSLQEKFADVEVSWNTVSDVAAVPNGNAKASKPVRINVIEALLKLTLEPAPIFALEARLAASECIVAFFDKHHGIRLHFLGRAIDGHMSGNDQIPNMLSTLLEAPETRARADPYRNWIASVLMFHLLFEDPEAKALALKVTEGNAEKGEEVVTCIQTVAGNLTTGLQRGDDDRISVASLMLLCGWLFEDPDAVNDFLGEGSIIQSLIQEIIKQSRLGNILIPGLCSILLGIIYEFSTKDSPIPRETLHSLLTSRLGREQYIDKITKLREDPLVRDFEVLPRSGRGDHDGTLPEIYFDAIFIEFLKDHFGHFLRAIDREPGLEVPVMTNGIQKGISRELVDSLRTQVEQHSQTIQKLELDLLNLQQKLEQEQLDHRRTKESTSHEMSRIKNINDSLQKNHEIEMSRLEDYYKGMNESLQRNNRLELSKLEEHHQQELSKLEEHHQKTITDLQKEHTSELSKLEDQHKQGRNELLKQHGEQLRAIDSQLKETTADYEGKSAKLRQRHEDEVSDLKKSIATLEGNLDKANKDHIQELQSTHEEHSTKYGALENQLIQADGRASTAEEGVQKLENELAEARKAIQKAESDTAEAENARKEAQSELEDLLIVFGDLETKRNQEKVRHLRDYRDSFHRNQN
jgi:intracellular protein transport protein USO1